MEAIEILKNNQIRVTGQRLKVLNYLLAERIHPTAEQIFSSIYDKKDILSLATVYNTLSIFIEKGIVKKLNGPGDKAIFDINISNHLHFHCNVCHKVYDLSENFKEPLTIDLGGHRAVEFHGYFEGECNQCNKGVKKSNLLNLFKQKVKIFTRR